MPCQAILSAKCLLGTIVWWTTKETEPIFYCKENLECLNVGLNRIMFCMLFVSSNDSKRKDSRSGSESKDRESSKERDKEKNKERDRSRDGEKEDDKDKRKQVLLSSIMALRKDEC